MVGITQPLSECAVHPTYKRGVWGVCPSEEGKSYGKNLLPSISIEVCFLSAKSLNQTSVESPKLTLKSQQRHSQQLVTCMPATLVSPSCTGRVGYCTLWGKGRWSGSRALQKFTFQVESWWALRSIQFSGIFRIFASVWCGEYLACYWSVFSNKQKAMKAIFNPKWRTDV